MRRTDASTGSSQACHAQHRGVSGNRFFSDQVRANSFQDLTFGGSRQAFRRGIQLTGCLTLPPRPLSPAGQIPAGRGGGGISDPGQPVVGRKAISA